MVPRLRILLALAAVALVTLTLLHGQITKPGGIKNADGIEKPGSVTEATGITRYPQDSTPAAYLERRDSGGNTLRDSAGNTLRVPSS